MKKRVITLIVMLCVVTIAAVCIMLRLVVKPSQAEETTEIQVIEETAGISTETVWTEVTEMEETEAAEEIKNYPQIISDDKLKDYGSEVVLGDCGYELYNYRDEFANAYAKAVNRLAKKVDGVAEVYTIIVPLGSGIIFPDNRTEELNNCSNQESAVNAIQEKLSEDVIPVNIYDTLMTHRDEYIYFRTDHHWTALGAYYAYEKFCEVKGIEAEALDSYQKKDFENYLGSFYTSTENKKMKKNPDTLTVYYPNMESVMTVDSSDGQEFTWPVIYDVESYGSSLKYSTFIAGDNPYTEIENLSLKDDSACIVVKESFGNAFVPFLVDHYQKIYVIDYRYWKGNLEKLTRQTKAEDIIFVNNLSMIRNQYLVGQLQKVIPK